MNNRAWIWALWLGWTLPVFAQPPGYMGKLWSAGVEAAAFPRVNLLSSQINPLRIQTSLGLDLSRVLTRRDEAGLHLVRIYSALKYDFGIGRPRVMGAAWLNGWRMGFHYRMFPLLSRGALAPIGLHHEVRADLLRYRILDLDRRFFPDSRRELGVFHDIGLAYALGMSRVLEGKYRVTVGMASGWLFQVFPDSPVPDEAYLRSIGLNRLRGQSALYAYVRLAWIR